MKIANPWPRWPHVRFRCPDGRFGVCGPCEEIEIPDDVVEVMIEPVDRGRNDAQVVTEGRMWTQKWGTLVPADYEAKRKMEKEQAEHDARMEADRVKREKAAREKAEAAKKAKEESKEEPKVTRTPSGLAKVEKPEK